MRTRLVIGATAAILAVVAWAGTPSSAQSAPLTPETGSVTVVHGLRGQLVDIYLDDELALKGFQPERVTDPLEIPAGEHRVALRPAGAPAAENPMAATVVTVTPGANMSLIAHLDTNGSTTVTAYRNDVSPLAPGKARLVARNTAEVPAIKLVISDGPAPTLEPEAEFAADVDPATYRVAVDDPAGGTIVPPDDVRAPEGSATIMYLIGSEPDDSLIWIGQSIADLQAPPTAVPTGNSGLAATPATRSGPLGVLGDVAPLAALLGLAIGVVMVRRHRLT